MTTILDAMDDPALFGAAFPGQSWAPWRSFLGTLFGLPMDDSAAQLASTCTGHRQDAPTSGPYREAWLVCGRRSGKSRVLAAIAVYLAAFVDWRPRLAAGETGVVMILAADRDQAGVILDYVRGLLRGNPMLARLVTDDGAEHVTLGSRKVAIAVHASSYRSVRGRTLVAALCDEVAFWRSDSVVNPAAEVVRALRPALATLAPDSLLIGASSLYSRSGLLYERYGAHYGREGSRVLVWQAASRTMNPSLPAELVADALADDPEAGAAEWLGEFRRDIVSYIGADVVDAATAPGRHELPRTIGTRYRGFLDPSGGSSDSFTMAIAHREGDRAVLDAIREVRPPFSPEVVSADFARLLLDYGITRAVADKYAGIWVVAAFAEHGVTVEQSAKPKSDLYGELLPGLNSGRVDLLDHPRLRTQLCSLERRTARSGRDSIDHGPGGHDDLANAVAGALVACLARPPAKISPTGFILGPSLSVDGFLSGDFSDDWKEISPWQH